MKFKECLGQEGVIDHLRSAIRLNKISHAYIINGESGYGKKQIAEAFAAALLCSQLNPDIDENQVTFPGMEIEPSAMPEVIEPCGECISCTKASHRNHPDIIYISHEKDNLITVSEIREQLTNTVDIKPYESKRKIYIVEDAHLMNEAAQNALLKTIEEPPSFVTIILLTDNKNNFLQTVLSRCVCLNMTPVSKAAVRQYLMEQGVVDYQADMAISFSEGNPGRALMIAKDVEFQARRKLVVDIIKHFPDYNAKEMADMAKELEADKKNIEKYLDLMVMFLKDVLVYKTTMTEDKVVFRQEINVVRNLSELHLSKINNLIEIVQDARHKIKINVTLGLTLEMMLHKMKETI